MGDANGGLCFVHMLSPCAGRSERIDLQIVRIDAHLHFFGFGQHRYSDCAGLNTALGLCFRHSLHPVNAAFKFQAGVCSLSFHEELGLFHAAQLRFAAVHHLHPKAFCFSIHGVHPQQRMRKQCCLLTSGTGPDLHNHITHIVGILGQQQKFYLLPQLLYV